MIDCTFQLSFLPSFSRNQGSIANFKEDDFSFSDRLPLQPSKSDFSLTPSHIDSFRATRGQSDIVDLVKLSSPSPVKSDHDFLSDEPQTGADVLSFPQLKDVSEGPLLNKTTSVEESDEDNDELDLIGSSAFSTEGEQRPVYTEFEQDTSLQGPHPVSADVAEEAVIEEDILMDDNDDNMQDDPYGESSSTRSPKHESMDVSQDDVERAIQTPPTIDVPEVAGADNIPLQHDSMPLERKEFATIVDPLFIREDIVIPIPLKPTRQVYHIDVSAAPKSLEPPISPVHYRQQYDPQYKLPPLNVLPAEFSRKTKTNKRKKERDRDKPDGKKDRDEVLPMGVSRWGATVLANPVWKRVSRATKCLSTREWGVRLHS